MNSLQGNPIVKKFYTEFNPKTQDHVLWLQTVHHKLENMDTMKCQIHEVINENPMKISFKERDMLDWVHIHFSLNFKYAQSVLKGEAHIP